MRTVIKPLKPRREIGRIDEENVRRENQGEEARDKEKDHHFARKSPGYARSSFRWK
jgi:hypothetical protein